MASLFQTLKFQSEVLAATMEDVWSGPREEGFDSDIYIKWRVEGMDGVAQGTIGWPDYPKGSPQPFVTVPGILTRLSIIPLYLDTYRCSIFAMVTLRGNTSTEFHVDT